MRRAPASRPGPLRSVLADHASALDVPGERAYAVPDAALAVVGGPWGQRAPTPLVRRCAPSGRSSGLLLAGLCAADWDAVEGFPWPGRPRGWAPLGSRSPGLRLAAAVFPAWRRRKVRCARSCVKARAARSQLRWVPALTPAPSAWASLRKQEEQKLQRPAAQRPGERRAHLAHPLFGGHGKPSYPCVSLQHTALRQTPWQKPFLFLTPEGRLS